MMWTLWEMTPPLSERFVEVTREKEPNGVEGPRAWVVDRKDLGPSLDPKGLWWRPWPGARKDAAVGPPEPPGGWKRAAGRGLQVDALGAALKAGEMYVSSGWGLIPVTPEGVRYLIDAAQASIDG